ncbi:MAG: peptidylprolyl isomerase [Alphaproteobacteria bacterium]|nr:peptidylprolyl isomerase [Alphaproteobacteria bacterium]
MSITAIARAVAAASGAVHRSGAPLLPVLVAGLVAIACPLAAQDAKKPADKAPESKAEAKPADAKPADTKPADAKGAAAKAGDASKPAKEEMAETGPRDGTRDPVLAIVDGLAIRRSEMIDASRMLPAEYQQLPMEMVYPVIVDRLIDIKLIAAKGRTAKLDQDAEVKRKVHELTERIIQEVYLTRHVQERVTEQGLRKRYDEWLAKAPPPKEVRVRHILVGSEERAKEILKRVKGGEDFAKVARESSIGPEAAKGGLLGWVGVNDMTASFRDAAFKLKAGEIGSAPVRTEFGWHVLKAEEERKIDPPSFPEMRDRLAAQWSNEIIQALLADTRKSANIQRFDYKPSAEDKPKDVLSPQYRAGSPLGTPTPKPEDGKTKQ